MIKGELRGLLDQLVPDKKWPKSTRLTDLVEFAVSHFATDTANTRERRALELARVLHDRERR